jgi:hypothetical protein
MHQRLTLWPFTKGEPFEVREMFSVRHRERVRSPTVREGDQRLVASQSIETLVALADGRASVTFHHLAFSSQNC